MGIFSDIEKISDQYNIRVAQTISGVYSMGELYDVIDEIYNIESCFLGQDGFDILVKEIVEKIIVDKRKSDAHPAWQDLESHAFVRKHYDEWYINIRFYKGHVMYNPTKLLIELK